MALWRGGGTQLASFAAGRSPAGLFKQTLIESSGLLANTVLFRHIKGKLWEIKIRASSGYRIFYIVIEKEMYLLHAYKKQGQKAPEREIETAFNRMKELLS